MSSQPNNQREIRVRPVVRYVLTQYDTAARGPVTMGEFDNAVAANVLAGALAHQARAVSQSPVEIELCRPLRIDVIRGAGQPRPAVRYELRDHA